MKYKMPEKKVKVVIDTNVVVSHFFGGKPADIILLWRNEKIEWCTSPEIIKEYEKVLMRPKFGLPDSIVENFIELIIANTTLVFPTVNVDIIKEDPHDNKFLECALESKSKFIVSGDKHLLSLKNYRNIEIVACAEFLSDYMGG
ncbi:MAG: uncharacterized protein PWQ60_2529 [Thermoanaerobacteraceae bacterium]|nr:uncharacterized protein [Thermoanaerobacteraceae bacterium]